MAEFDEKLSAILGDPEAMGQIVSIAKALTDGMGGGDASAGEAPAPQPVPEPQAGAAAPAPAQEAQAPAPPPVQGPSGGPDWSAVMGLLGSLSGGGGAAAANPLGALGDLDPRLIQTAIRLFSEYSATDDRKIALLTAIKPFVKEERYAKVDKAVQIAKLSRVIRVAFQLFKDNGEGGES